MGIKITKETLEKIYKDYEANKSKIPKSKPKIEIKNNINDIIKRNLINNNLAKNKKLSEIKKNIKEEKKNNIIENKNQNEINTKQINNILFQRHKSFELLNIKEFEDNLNLNDNNNYFNENLSMNDNSSVNSDYVDISNEPILLNRIKKNENKKLKSIKLRNSYYSKLIYSKILTFQK